MDRESTFMGIYINKKKDEKNRVVIPAPFREILEGEYKSQDLVLSTEEIAHIVDNLDSHPRPRETYGGNDKYLCIYPQETWEEWATKVSEKDVDLGLRFGLFSIQSYDSQGRILIPEHLVNHSKIKSYVCVIGAVDRIEIMNPGIARKRRIPGY